MFAVFYLPKTRQIIAKSHKLSYTSHSKPDYLYIYIYKLDGRPFTPGMYETV